MKQKITKRYNGPTGATVVENDLGGWILHTGQTITPWVPTSCTVTRNTDQSYVQQGFTASMKMVASGATADLEIPLGYLNLSTCGTFFLDFYWPGADNAISSSLWVTSDANFNTNRICFTGYVKNGWNRLGGHPAFPYYNSTTFTAGTVDMTQIRRIRFEMSGCTAGDTTYIQHLRIGEQTECDVWLRFDDEYGSIDYAKTKMDVYGVKGVIGFANYFLARSASYMTAAQLSTYQNTNGWEIANHTNLHVDYSSATDVNTVANDYGDNEKIMMQYGWTKNNSHKIYIAPFGGVNQVVRDAAKKNGAQCLIRTLRAGQTVSDNGPFMGLHEMRTNPYNVKILNPRFASTFTTTTSTAAAGTVKTLGTTRGLIPGHIIRVNSGTGATASAKIVTVDSSTQITLGTSITTANGDTITIANYKTGQALFEQTKEAMATGGIVCVMMHNILNSAKLTAAPANDDTAGNLLDWCDGDLDEYLSLIEPFRQTGQLRVCKPSETLARMKTPVAYTRPVMVAPSTLTDNRFLLDVTTGTGVSIYSDAGTTLAVNGDAVAQANNQGSVGTNAAPVATTTGPILAVGVTNNGKTFNCLRTNVGLVIGGAEAQQNLTSTWSSTAQPIHIVAVSRFSTLNTYSADTAQDQFLFEGDNTARRHMIKRANASNANQFQAYSGTTLGGPTASSNPDALCQPDTNWHIFEYVSNGNSSALIIDGTVITEAAGSISSQGVTIGNSFAPAATPRGIGTDCAFIGVWANDHWKTRKMDPVRAYLADRFGITLLTPF